MNTADRSIRLLDAALRRRFAFIELMPDTEPARRAQSSAALISALFLALLNDRIAKVEGREKQIGHSFLLDETGRPARGHRAVRRAVPARDRPAAPGVRVRGLPRARDVPRQGGRRRRRAADTARRARGRSGAVDALDSGVSSRRSRSGRRASMTRRVVRLREWESDRRESGREPVRPADRTLAEALSAARAGSGSRSSRTAIRFDASRVGRRRPVLERRGAESSRSWSARISAFFRCSSTRAASARSLASNRRGRSPSDRDGSLVDLLALLLAEGSIEIAKRGILQDYVTREESLTRVRGRLLPYEQAIRQFGQLKELECRFDELETDIVGEPAARGRARDREARCRRPRGPTADGSRPRRLLARSQTRLSRLRDTPELDYNRRNEHYRSAHVLARLFLRNLAVERPLFAWRRATRSRSCST